MRTKAWWYSGCQGGGTVGVKVRELGFLLGNPMDRGAWRATVHGGHKRFRHDLVTKQERSFFLIIFICTYYFGYTEKI